MHDMSLYIMNQRSYQACSLSSPTEHAFKREHIILWFLNGKHLPVLRKDQRSFLGENFFPESAGLCGDKMRESPLHLLPTRPVDEAKILKERLCLDTRATAYAYAKKSSLAECGRVACHKIPSLYGLSLSCNIYKISGIRVHKNLFYIYL